MPTIQILKKPGWLGEFQAFIMRGNVVDLAVGIVVGAAFTNIVQSLVKDIFNPIIGLAIGGIDFSNYFVTLKGTHAATLDQAQRAGAVTLNVGLFLNAVIQFIILAFIVFLVVKALSAMYRKSETVAKPTASELLLAEIRDELRAPGRTIAPPT